MPYVDGYVVPIPEKNLAAYRKIARLSGKIWREHGAIQYCECVGDALSPQWGLPFTKAVKVKAGETVMFSWVMFKSKAHRDSVNKKVMTDPRLLGMMDPKNMPFDCKRMVYGGFKVLVDA